MDSLGEELQERIVRAVEQIKPAIREHPVVRPVGIHYAVLPYVLGGRVVVAPIIGGRHPVEVIQPPQEIVLRQCAGPVTAHAEIVDDCAPRDFGDGVISGRVCVQHRCLDTWLSSFG